jgi:hypothetical protein
MAAQKTFVTKIVAAAAEEKLRRGLDHFNSP